MIDVAPLPDAVLVAVRALRADPSVDAIVAGRVYSRRLPEGAERPALVVTRIGGVPAHELRVDRARLQVDAWGTSEKQAHDLAQIARAALIGMRNRSGDGAVVHRVDTELGLTWNPDPTEDAPRYLFGVGVQLRAD